MTKNVCAASLTVLLSAICLTSLSAAQTKWWRTYGGPNDDVGYAVQQTSDSGYVVTGQTCSRGDPFGDVYLIKTNSQGDTLWTRSYGGAHGDLGKSVQQTADGGYIIAGGTASLGPGIPAFDNVYLIKTNVSGDTLWTRAYGGMNQDAANSVQQTSDSGYIVAGVTFSFGDSNGDIYLLKTNSQGDTLWTRTYGGTKADIGTSVQQTLDGGYIVTGITMSFGAGSYDVYLVKTDAQGDTLWTRTYGGGSADMGYSVQQTTDRGYIVAGFTASSGTGSGDVYLVKTDSIGDTLWTRTYGGDSLDYGECARPTADGGYIIVGYTGAVGSGDVYLVKTNASGDTLWTRTHGGMNTDLGYSVQQTADGGYIMAGYTQSFGAGGQDIYLIKTDASGIGVSEPLTRRLAGPTRLLVQPNPFTSVARVPGHETELFALSDVTGRQVAVCRGNRVGEGLRPGVYFLSPVGLRAGKAATAPVIKVAF